MLRDASAAQRERAAEAAEWAKRSEGQLRHKLAQRVAQGAISQQAADAVFARDTAFAREALAAQVARIEEEASRLHGGVVSSIVEQGRAASRVARDVA